MTGSLTTKPKYGPSSGLLELPLKRLDSLKPARRSRS